ncbi:hypothetical protein C8R43DRAFT_889361 [Mycena crocata]|nr:hypothetical protein C8R43DRAFT_889361 [Mycena crocata]
MICPTIPTDAQEDVSDLNCAPFVEFASQAHREPSRERPVSRSAEQELASSNDDNRLSLPDDNGSADSWPGLAVPRVSESWWSPPTPITALPQVMYFDIYGTLIDKESGIFAALGPLLSQSLYQFERREALSFYLESETEVKKRNPDASYAQILAYTYEDVALRLGIQPESTGSSVFSRSIEGWPVIYAAEWCLATLRTITSITLIAIADVDRDSLERTASFTLLRPHVHDVFTRDRCKFDTNKTQYRSGLAPAFVHTALNEHSAIALSIPRDQTCFVSNSLFDMEPARELGIPTVWARYPESLAGNVYYMEDEWPEVFVMFVGLVELASSFLLLADPRAENASDELDLDLLDPDGWPVPDDG